jgi:HEAT repeat protein
MQLLKYTAREPNTAARIFLLLLGFMFIFCCSPESTDSQKQASKTGPDTSPAAAQQVVKLKPVDDPVDHALSLLDLQSNDLVRPLAHEAGYNLIARNPLIDHLATSPFHLHHWADVNSRLLQQNARRGFQNGLTHLIALLNGGVSYAMNPDAADSAPGVIGAYDYICRQYGIAGDQKILEQIRAAGLSDEFDRRLGALIVQITQGAKLTQAAFAALDDQEMIFLKQRPERFFFPDGIQFNFLTAATHTQAKAVSIGRKIDFVSLFQAAVLISSSIADFTDFIRGLEDIHDPAHYFSNAELRQGMVLRVPTAIGNIVVLGQGDNVYGGKAALVVDLGGNDIYMGRLGVGHLLPGRISIGIDIAGNDIYDCKKKRYAQGLGVTGIGMIVDCGGNDRYLAGDMAQGSGIYGVGLVADFAGNDIYRMGLMGQGFGVFGVGLLLDAAGNDKYMLKGMGQGTGSTLGLGSLCDLEGNDKYIADRNQKRGRLGPDDWSHAQGAGLSIRSPDWIGQLSLYGGIGILNDGQGNDFYFASDGNAMGSSYFMSVGVLVDHSGHDRYIPQNGSGLGYAVHLSNAIVIDREGNDYYFAQSHSGGVGSDRSIALLVDYAGDDIYGPSKDLAAKELNAAADSQKNPALTAEELEQQIQTKLADVSYGSALKPKALGFLIDVGGNDQYFARHSGWGESLGGVTPPADPQNWSHAFLIDLNGKDIYSKQGRSDNHYVIYYNHGLCYDTEYTGPLPLKTPPLTPAARTAAQGIAKFQTSVPASFYETLRRLTAPDLFVRYNALGLPPLMDKDSANAIIAVLSASSNTELNRDLLEALIINILAGRLKLAHNPAFELLLSAPDPFVRRFAARVFGWFRVKSAATALLASQQESNADLRAEFIWALGQVGSVQAVDLLLETAQNDADIDCRRSALDALRKLTLRKRVDDSELLQKMKPLFVSRLSDIDAASRKYAAEALRKFQDEPPVITALKQGLNDPDVYVQRAAAKSLALSGVKAGIPVIIETLRYPSIDTFEHYDRDLFNDLAYFTGVDFPEEKRYNYLTWKTWWQENGQHVQLHENLAIMKKIIRASNVPHEERGIAIFEKLIVEHPQNAVIKRRYQRFCYEWIAYRLLTRAKVNKDILRRCLRLQQIITTLDSDNPEALASLAYFQVRLNKFNAAIATIQKAIELDPDDTTLRQSLELYRDLRKQPETRINK